MKRDGLARIHKFEVGSVSLLRWWVIQSGPVRVRRMPTQLCELHIFAESWGEGHDVSEPQKDTQGVNRECSVV